MNRIVEFLDRHDPVHYWVEVDSTPGELSIEYDQGRFGAQYVERQDGVETRKFCVARASSLGDAIAEVASRLGIQAGKPVSCRVSFGKHDIIIPNEGKCTYRYEDVTWANFDYQEIDRMMAIYFSEELPDDPILS